MAEQRSSVLVERSLWILLVGAPWILHVGTGNFTPIWGAPDTPTWTVAGVFIAAGVGSVLGWLGIRRGLPKDHRVRYAGIVTLAVLGLTPIALFALFQIVHIFAVVLAIPYALALTGAWVGSRRTPTWHEK